MWKKWQEIVTKYLKTENIIQNMTESYKIRPNTCHTNKYKYNSPTRRKIFLDQVIMHNRTTTNKSMCKGTTTKIHSVCSCVLGGCAAS